jgi:hypothetical protein
VPALLAVAKHRIAIATQEATEPKEIGFFLQCFQVHGADEMYFSDRYLQVINVGLLD